MSTIRANSPAVDIRMNRFILLTAFSLACSLVITACGSVLISSATANALALGDLDGDGDLDAFIVAQGSFGQSAPDQVWLNDGTGRFSDSGQRLGQFIGLAAALGDLDSDGDLDAYVVTADSGDHVYFNSGQGRFDFIQPLAAYPPSALTIADHRAIALGDLDSDGDLDAFSLGCCPLPGDPPASFIWINNGQGGFSLGQTLEFRGGIAIALGDLDMDNDLDAFIAGGDTPDQVWTNQGGVQAGEPASFAPGWQAVETSSSFAVALGDLDSDGDVDAFTGTAGPNLLWFNDGAGGFINSGQRLGNLDTRSVALVDLDGDGDLDAFITGIKDGEIWLNDIHGVFTNSRQLLAYSSRHAAAMGDLDGDSDLDVLVASPGRGVKRWVNQGAAQGGTQGTFKQER